MTEQQQRVRLIIHGRVQGVFFRASTMETAFSLGLTGWVRNRPEGTVETVAEGPAADIERFVKWCHGGPRSARVDKVEQERSTALGDMVGFEVTY